MEHKIKKHTSGLIIAVLFYLFSAQPVTAEEHKQHAAHVHGIAQLNLAMENNELYIELISPAADIIGFEHTPETKEEKSAMQKAVGKLRVGKRMFEFSKEAGVRFEKAVVKTGLQHECDHDHETHDSKHHDHEEGANGQHSDVAVEYRFLCATPDKLKSIDVKLFKYFKSLEKIHVQVLTRTKQTAVELTNENTTIPL